MADFYLDLIEDVLIDGNIDVEDYNDPERGISKAEAICDAIERLIFVYNNRIK